MALFIQWLVTFFLNTPLSYVINQQ